jgi:hypothetical protein
VFDFVLAAIAVPLLIVGIWGLAIIGGALADLNSINRDCADQRCDHQGNLVDWQRTKTVSSRFTAQGVAVDYCVLTLDLDVGRQQMAIPGPACKGLAGQSHAVAQIWRGTIVSVRLPSGSYSTYLNPNLAVGGGLLRMAAFVPVILLIGMIEFDVTSHLRRQGP